MGLSYIVSVVSLFDEYVNDLLYMREGSCLPRYMIEFLFSPSLHHNIGFDYQISL